MRRDNVCLLFENYLVNVWVFRRVAECFVCGMFVCGMFVCRMFCMR